MAMNLGINVVEVDGATPSIQGAATSVPGFVFRTQRGVSGVVRQITNFTQFVDYFGGYVDSKDPDGVQTSYVGTYAIRGFFDNGGGLAYVMRFVDTKSPPNAATKVFNDANSKASLTATAGYRGQDDPGTWGNSIAINIAKNTDDPKDANVFDVTVARVDSAAVDKNGAAKVVAILETWRKLKIGGGPGVRKPEVINDPNTGSKYIWIKMEQGAALPKDTGQDFVALAGGTDDNADDLDNAMKAVFDTPSPFDTFDISLLACPDNAGPATVDAALTYCKNRGDCMFVGHVPGNDPKAYSTDLRKDKVYGALYYPYIQVADPIGTFVWIPPTGHVLGVYARTDQQRGIWKAPAGNAAVLNNVLDVKARLSDTEHTDLVKKGSVNAIRPISGVGIVIDSSRTLSTNTLWLYVNVRLLFNYVETSLKYGLRWVVQEPNDQTLWNKVKFNSVLPFLTGLWRRGAFGPGGPDDVVKVKIDAENNPPETIQQGMLNIEVYFYPSRPAETIVITVGQNEGGASVREH